MSRSDATPDSVELTQSFVRLSSLSGSAGQTEVMRSVGDVLAAFDYAVSLDPKGNFMTALPRGIDRDLMIFSCHVDTVPSGASGRWSVSPFGGEIDHDRLYGRGASDMKGGLAAAVAALCRTIESGAPAGLVLTADEEIGCLGARSAVAALERLHISGMIIPESTGNVPRFGHRGAAWLNLLAHGVSAHASTPDLGRNAVMLMAEALVDLEQNGPRRQHPYLGRTTISAGTMTGGAAVNVVPEHAEASIDVRYVEPGEADDLWRWLSDRHPHLELASISDCGPVYSDGRSPWIAALLGTHIVDKPVPYFTDASVFARAFPAVPTVVWGPGHPSQPHVTDEYVEVRRVHEAADLYEGAIRRHLAQTQTR